MFRNRQSSQRPPEEFIERFKQAFPGVRTTSASAEEHSGAIAGNFQEHQPRSQFPPDHEDLDPTPRAPGEPFRFTPSLLDPTSTAFHAFAEQPAGIYSPQTVSTGGGFNVSDVLQTPNFGLTMGTPMTLSNNVSMAPPSSGGVGGFIPMQHQMHPHDYHSYDQFTPTIQPQYVDQGYGRMPSGPGSPMDTSDVEPGLQMAGYTTTLQHQQRAEPDFYSNEKFRFHVTLHAPTAMVKSAEEIPVTYLNKGQAYALTIRDTKPPAMTDRPPRYRTYVRISFHDESQRQKPGVCWQLWKEGRGTNEAHQRGGKLQAVEFVENPGTEQESKSKVDLETSSFDSFAVTWSPNLNGPCEGSVSVRFNFLSTDFSHSKGVKGIPVRLCAKTEMLPSETSPPPAEKEAAEICYCKVKLFRDHGAERKLANDILHIRKTMDKLRQQAAQAEGNGMKLFGKKKRDEEKHSKPGKAPKHKRTWSMSSATSLAGKAMEDDTSSKLMALEAMFSSTRSVSVLFLRGSEEDDPDLHPVHLPGESQSEFPGDVWARRRSSVATTASSFVSPTPSSVSLAGSQVDLASPERSWSYQNVSQDPVRVRAQSETGQLNGWIEAIGVDASYRPPADSPPKAVMSCFVLPVFPGTTNNATYYRAVYLKERSRNALSSAIASKCGLDPSTVIRLTYVSARGITILIDDDFVKQMNEGQDMKVQAIEIDETGTLSPPQDWEGQEGAGHASEVKKEGGRGWELRLAF